MKKVLFTAKVDSHILHFHIPYLKFFHDNGYEVHVACNGTSQIPYANFMHNIPFNRNPLNHDNIKSFKILKNLINENNYEIIHCHTPIAGALTRLASIRARRKGTKIIYTAHGFHFYKGAPIINWLIYYPIEKYLSRYTDCLITINDEDYNLAIRKKFKSKLIKQIDGVGIDLNKFKPQNEEIKNKLRTKLGYDNETFIVLYVAEMSYRKHQDMLIKTTTLLKDKIKNFKILLVGEGEFFENYIELSRENKVANHMEFLGYRKDIPNLMQITDLVVSTSRQEGLPVNIMEAMATGLPLVVSDCRGNRDLVKNGQNGYVVELDNIKDFSDKIIDLYQNKELRNKFGIRNLEYVDKYKLSLIFEEMKSIYNAFLL